MIGRILSWLNPLGALADGLADAYRAKLAAKNDEQRIEADKQIAFFQGQMQLAQVATQHDKWWSTREMIGKCVLIYIFKIVVWDTVLGWGVTPDPGPVVGGIVMVTIGFYFGAKAVTDIGARLLATIGRR